MSDIIASDTQGLSESSGIITLYELHFATWTKVSGSGATLYFHSEDQTTDITFNSQAYVALPIAMEGIEQNMDGPSARPILRVANVESLINNSPASDFVTSASTNKNEEEGTFKMDDLVGAKLTRIRTLEKYLASGFHEFPRDVYIIDRIASKNQFFVELELANPMDLSGVRLPARVVVGKYCPWQYKVGGAGVTKSGCTWTGTRDIDGTSDRELFFNQWDEMLVSSAITSATEHQGAWSGVTTYAKNEWVTSGGLEWRSNADSNLNNTPSEGDNFWTLARTYAAHSTASVSYTFTDTDPRTSSYVISGGVVYICTLSHTSAVGHDPATDTTRWRPAELCGKLLSSCKVRFQADPKLTSNSIAHPDADQNTEAILPFGGFPASRKFR